MKIAATNTTDPNVRAARRLLPGVKMMFIYIKDILRESRSCLPWTPVRIIVISTAT